MVLLSGGVGGARLARGMAGILIPDDLTVIVNVGDDDAVYGVDISPDVDTVCYTIAGIEGRHGWGVDSDTFTMLGHLENLGIDTTFRLGDRDLALNMARTVALRSGETLSAVTARLGAALGVEHRVLPVTDDRLRTRIRVAGGEWLDFQDYFVRRGHRDRVTAVAFDGADQASPAPGVIDAITAADVVVVAPSNPPLSIWPILAVPGLRAAMRGKMTVAVSPLFSGKALKGPAADVLLALGLAPGNAGIAAAYEGLIDGLIVDVGDRGDAESLQTAGLRVGVTDTRFARAEEAERFAAWLIEWSTA